MRIHTTLLLAFTLTAMACDDVAPLANGTTSVAQANKKDKDSTTDMDSEMASSTDTETQEGTDSSALWEEPIVLYNGVVFTGADKAQDKWAEAVAIENGKIAKVGTTQSVRQFAGGKGTLIDLQGRLVIPGLNDAHIHLLPANPSTGIALNNPMEFIPGSGPTVPEMLGLIEAAVATHPAGTWFYGNVGEAFIEDSQANRVSLDLVSPEHPVVIQGWAGHNLYVNTAAMMAMGLAEDAPDPFGGFYGRQADGVTLNGVLYEYAEYEFIRRIRQAQTVEQLRAAYLAVLSQLTRLGITSVQAMDWLPWAQLEDIFADQEVPVRVRVICFPVTPEEAASECQPPPSGANLHHMVTFMGVKWILDGTPVERLAATIEPYSDDPLAYGYVTFPQSVFETIVDEAVNHGAPDVSQRLFHAIGDRSIADLLNAMDELAPDGQWKGARVRLEHGDLLHGEQVQDLVDKGVVVTQNPTHFALPALYLERFGAARVAAVQPLRSLLEAGVPVALGSDAIGAGANPFVDMMFAVLHPTNPDEAITLEQALLAYTKGAAYAEFAEQHKGTLENGNLADLAVLSQNIFEAPILWLPMTHSLLTIADGKVTFDAGVLAPSGP